MADGGIAVRVRFTGPFREWAATDQLLVTLHPPARVRDLLAALGEALGPRFQSQVLDDLARRRYTARVLLINGQHALARGGEDATLAAGDVVTLVPPMEGG
jgi:molybdopterin converting factor small subunit